MSRPSKLRTLATILVATVAACAEPPPTAPESELPVAAAVVPGATGTVVPRTYRSPGDGRYRFDIIDVGGVSGREEVRDVNGTTTVAVSVLELLAENGTHFTEGRQGFGIQGPDDSGDHALSIEGDEALVFRLTSGEARERFGGLDAHVELFGDAATVEIAGLEGDAVIWSQAVSFDAAKDAPWTFAFPVAVRGFRISVVDGRAALKVNKGTSTLDIVQADAPPPPDPCQVPAYSEDFSADPGFTTPYAPRTGEFFRWDEATGSYQVRMLEEHDVRKWAMSPAFSRTVYGSFTLQVDIKVVEQSWGMPINVFFADEDDTGGMWIGHTGTNNRFRVSDRNGNTYASPATVQNGVWYRHELDYDHEHGTMDYTVTDRDAGTVLFQATGVLFAPGPFDRMMIGDRTLHTDGQVVQIHVDNVVVGGGCDDPPPPPPPFEALYRFDDSGEDALGNGPTAVLGGGSFTPGLSGNGRLLDGVDDYIQVADIHPWTDQITLAAWVRADEAGEVIAFDKHGELFLKIENGRYRMYLAGVQTGTGSAIEAQVDVVQGRWYHLAGSYDGATVNLYLNGELVASQPGSGSLLDSTYPLFIGSDRTAVHQYMAGVVDDAYLAARALTLDEICAVSDAGCRPYRAYTFDQDGYFVEELPVTGGAPYEVEFDFEDPGNGVVFMAGFRKEGGAGVHRDLEIGFRAVGSPDHYVVDRYVGVIGSGETDVVAPVEAGWHTVRMVVRDDGNEVWLDGALVSAGPFTFTPDKLWLRVANGPVPGVASSGPRGTVRFRVYYTPTLP